MMEFKCANCKKVIQFNEKDAISLRCHSCGSGEIIFQDRISRQCIVCKAEEIIEPGAIISGRHDCWSRGYIWIVKEKVSAIKNAPSLEAAKQSFMEKVRTIINPKEKVDPTLNKAANLKDLEAEKDEEIADSLDEQKQPETKEEELTGNLGFDELPAPETKEETTKPPVAKEPKKEVAAAPFKRRSRG